MVCLCGCLTILLIACYHVHFVCSARHFPPPNCDVKFHVDSQPVRSRGIGESNMTLVWIKTHTNKTKQAMKGRTLWQKLAQNFRLLTEPVPLEFPPARVEVIASIELKRVLELLTKECQFFLDRADSCLAKGLPTMSRETIARRISVFPEHAWFYHRGSTDPPCRFCAESDETFIPFATNCPGFALSTADT